MSEIHRRSECQAGGWPECMGRLGAIEAKLDIVLQNKVDTEARLRVLERRDAYVVCICGLLSIGAPYLFKYVLHL